MAHVREGMLSNYVCSVLDTYVIDCCGIQGEKPNVHTHLGVYGSDVLIGREQWRLGCGGVIARIVPPFYISCVELVLEENTNEDERTKVKDLVQVESNAYNVYN